MPWTAALMSAQGIKPALLLLLFVFSLLYDGGESLQTVLLLLAAFLSHAEARASLGHLFYHRQDFERAKRKCLQWICCV